MPVPLVGQSPASPPIHPVFFGLPNGEVRDSVLLTAAYRLMSGIILMVMYDSRYCVE